MGRRRAWLGWALGLLAFRLLTGCHYFRAANDPQGSLQAVMREALVEPLIAASARAGEYGASVPPGFDAWFSRAVDREPSQRFRTASEALFELEREARTLVTQGAPSSTGLAFIASLPQQLATRLPRAGFVSTAPMCSRRSAGRAG